MTFCPNADCRCTLPEHWSNCSRCGTHRRRSTWRWAKLAGGRLQVCAESDAAPVEVEDLAPAVGPRTAAVG